METFHTCINMTTNLNSLTITNPTYVACIMWKDINGVVYRYKLWEDVGETGYLLSVPLYAGQVIMKNFRFEIWSLSGAITTESVGSNILTSVLKGQDYRYTTDGLLKNNDGLVTNFNCQNATTDNFPVIASMQARWRAGSVSGNQWPSIDGNNYIIRRLDGSGANIVTVDDGALAHSTTVPAYSDEYNTGLFNNIQPAHYFMLCKIDTSVIAQLMIWLGGDDMFISIYPIDGTTSNLILADGNSCVITLGIWYVLEIAYSAGLSRIKPYELSKSPVCVPYPINFASSATDTGGTHDIILAGGSANNAGCSFVEIVSFNQYIGEGATNQVLSYFYDYYNINFPLPLVFPTNSSPQPNT